MTATPSLQEVLPIWSPDGNALTYTMSGGGGVWVVRRRNGVWGKPVMRAGGGLPAWSPDGRRIAYTTDGFNGGSLFIINPDSGAPRLVFDWTKHAAHRALQPLWSADSRTLYFKSLDASGNAEFWSVPIATGEPTLLTRISDPMQGSYREEWGVGSGRMYFAVDDRQSDVWVMQATPR